VNDSLSIVWPLCDAEATLAGHLARLLEMLPDLTGRFEIVLVDDASTDQTLDVARELAARYPQVRVIRHRDRRGAAAAVRTGLQWARGATIFIHDDPPGLCSRDLARLWRERKRQQLVYSAPHGRRSVFDEPLLARLAAWGHALEDASAASGRGGLAMIRREAIGKLLADESIDEASTIASHPREAQRADPSHDANLRRPAATFLRHLQTLALGE
jgi:glycosyltransferase involved in cell wall biosynthesis